MRVMSKDIQKQQHARYLADPENCWKSFDYTTAKSGKDDEIVRSTKKSFEDLEKWWDNSYDIDKDSSKIQTLVDEEKKRRRKKKRYKPIVSKVCILW